MLLCVMYLRVFSLFFHLVQLLVCLVSVDEDYKAAIFFMSVKMVVIMITEICNLLGLNIFRNHYYRYYIIRFEACYLFHLYITLENLRS